MNPTQPPDANSDISKVKADLLMSGRDSQFVLPRSGWQDRQAWLKALIKAKRALDIAEIEFLVKQKY